MFLHHIYLVGNKADNYLTDPDENCMVAKNILAEIPRIFCGNKEVYTKKFCLL